MSIRGVQTNLTWFAKGTQVPMGRWDGYAPESIPSPDHVISSIWQIPYDSTGQKAKAISVEIIATGTPDWFSETSADIYNSGTTGTRSRCAYIWLSTGDRSETMSPGGRMMPGATRVANGPLTVFDSVGGILVTPYYGVKLATGDFTNLVFMPINWDRADYKVRITPLEVV